MQPKHDPNETQSRNNGSQNNKVEPNRTKPTDHNTVSHIMRVLCRRNQPNECIIITLFIKIQPWLHLTLNVIIQSLVAQVGVKSLNPDLQTVLRDPCRDIAALDVRVHNEKPLSRNQSTQAAEGGSRT